MDVDDGRMFIDECCASMDVVDGCFPTTIKSEERIMDRLTCTTYTKYITVTHYARSWSGQGCSEVAVLKRCVLSLDLMVVKESDGGRRAIRSKLMGDSVHTSLS